MNRTQKKEWVESMNGVFSSTGVVIVTHYKGLNVAEISELRNNIRDAGASFKVTNNLLTKIALAGSPYESLRDLFVGPTAIAYAEDPVAAAKAIALFAKENEKLVMVGGAFGDTILDEAGVKKLATMASLDEIRAKIVALINTPATRIAGVTQAPAGQIARVIGAFAAKG